MHKDIKVISFDLDGVLYDGRSASAHIASFLGLGDGYKALFARMATEDHSFEELIQLGTDIWKGVVIDDEMKGQVLKLPLMKGTEETLKALKEAGYIVGCISSGVSQFFMDPLARRLELDFSYSNILGETDGAHDGTYSFAMGGAQKAETALRLLKDRNLSTKNLASVGNGENDIPLFSISELSIAFNPLTELVSEAATVTVNSKSLDAILEYFV